MGLLSSGVVGEDGSDGVGVSECMALSSSSSSGVRVAIVGGVVRVGVSGSNVSDIGESGCILLRSPGESAPGAVLERFNGFGRARWRSEFLRSKGFGEDAFRFGGNTIKRYDGEATAVTSVWLRGIIGISRSWVCQLLQSLRSCIITYLNHTRRVLQLSNLFL